MFIEISFLNYNKNTINEVDQIKISTPNALHYLLDGFGPTLHNESNSNNLKIKWSFQQVGQYLKEHIFWYDLRLNSPKNIKTISSKVNLKELKTIC